MDSRKDLEKEINGVPSAPVVPKCDTKDGKLGKPGGPVVFKYDFIDANPTSSSSSEDLFIDANPTDPSEDLAAELSPKIPIPTRKGSTYLDTPNSPYSREYAMKGKSRGKVVIFNQVSFEDAEVYSKRDGTNADVVRLYKTLPKLGFAEKDIIVCENYKLNEINREVIKLETDEALEEADCLVVVILTHGEEGDYLMAYNDRYHLYKFIENFTPTALKSMAGRPKIFIVQACRGTKKDSGVQMRSKMMSPQIVTDSAPKDYVDSQVEFFTYPEFADLLIVMSSHHGHYSFRNAEGSWMIQELCNVIDSCDLDSSSIFDILTQMNNAVALRSSNADGDLNNKKQIPSFYSTLTKQLYFRKNQE